MCMYLFVVVFLKIKEMMKEKKVFASLQMYFTVMEELSRNGHGSLVEDVLGLIHCDSSMIHGEDYTVSSLMTLIFQLVCIILDLRFLCYSCYSREELEVPLIVIKHLSRMNGVNSLILSLYVCTAQHKGQSTPVVLQQLQEHVNLESFSWVSGLVNNHDLKHSLIIEKVQWLSTQLCAIVIYFTIINIFRINLQA